MFYPVLVTPSGRFTAHSAMGRKIVSALVTSAVTSPGKHDNGTVKRVPGDADYQPRHGDNGAYGN